MGDDYCFNTCGSLNNASVNENLMEIKSAVPFQKFPDLVMTLIMSYLPLRDKIRAKDVCSDWNSFIRSRSSLWKIVSMDVSSPYFDGWRRINLRQLDGSQLITDLNEFILQIADTTNSIQSFRIDIRSIDVNDISVYKRYESFIVTLSNLLIKQMKLLSLKLDLPDSSGQFNNQLIVDIVDKHQKTIEYLSISGSGISMENWQRCLATANFPNLKSVSYPWHYTYQKWSWNDQVGMIARSTLRQCFERTLNAGKVEEINMDIEAQVTEFPFQWSRSFVDSLKSQIEQGKAKKLRKILLDSLSNKATFGFNICDTSSDVKTLIRNCPKLTHLKCHNVIYGTECMKIQGKPFIDLIRHYSSQLVMLECGITDEIAGIISNVCPNLSSLTVLGEDELSDKGLLALSTLTKLQHLHLIIEFMINPATPNGVVNLLINCIPKLQTLELELPYIFFIEKEIYSVICNSSTALHSLKFNAFDEFRDRKDCENYEVYGTEEYVTRFIDGLLKISNLCKPLRHLTAINDHYIIYDKIRINSEKYKIRINSEKFKTVDLFDSIVRHQTQLETLKLKIQVMIPIDYKDLLINALPHCKIDLNFIYDI